MADVYNWKSHCKTSLSLLDDAQGFQRYHLQNETGEGFITAWPCSSPGRSIRPAAAGTSRAEAFPANAKKSWR